MLYKSCRVVRAISTQVVAHNSHPLLFWYWFISYFGRIRKKTPRKWRTLSDLLFYLSLKERWTLYGKGETVLCNVFMFWTRFLTVQVFWLCLWARIHSVCGRGGVKFFWFVCFVFNIAEFPDKERGVGMGCRPPHHNLIP